MYRMLLLVVACWPTIVVSFAPGTNSFHTKLHKLQLARSPFSNSLSRRDWIQAASGLALITGVSSPAQAKLEAVNRPDLLPSEQGLNVIQTEKYLTSGQARRMNELLTNLERDTGYRVKVLCQNYPNTPGLAIREYWDLGKPVRQQ